MRHNFKKLEVWKEGISIVKLTYQMTEHFLSEERYSLSNQIQRSAVSIPSNIAEGTSRKSDKHFVTYLENALGSAYEWDTQLIVAFEIGYIKIELFEQLEKSIQNLQGKLVRLIGKLETKS